jgi:hypothetical protein
VEKAETLAERLGLSYDHLLGFRFAANVSVGEVLFGCVMGMLVS